MVRSAQIEVADERARLLGQSSVTVWLTGLPGAGKSTLARALERALVLRGRVASVLDGDDLRQALCWDLGFSREDRHENARRAAQAARLLNQAGVIVLAAFISPYTSDRAMAKQIVGAERFVEVYVQADLATCEGRDPNGLYRKARAHEISKFTGITAPYEPPETPDLVLNTAIMPLEACVSAAYDCIGPRIRPMFKCHSDSSVAAGAERSMHLNDVD